MENLTLALPDELFCSLAMRARSEGMSPDEFVLHSLERTLGIGSEDPLLQALGTLQSNTPDLSERHDVYLAQARCAVRVGY
jgi:hypothetical protein